MNQIYIILLGNIIYIYEMYHIYMLSRNFAQLYFFYKINYLV